MTIGIATHQEGSGTEHALSEPSTLGFIESMAKEHGASSRVFKTAVLFSVPSDAAALNDEARKLLAWEDIHKEVEAGETKLDTGQQRFLRESIHNVKGHLKEAVWQAYKQVYLVGEGNALSKVDFGRIHSSAAASLVELILSRLRQDDIVCDKIGPTFVVRNWPPALPEWSTKAMRDAFYASPKLRRLSHPNVLVQTIIEGVSQGQFAYVARSAGGYDPFRYKEAIHAGDIELSDDVFLIRDIDAEEYLERLKGGDGPPSSVPPPPSSGGRPPSSRPTRPPKTSSSPPPSVKPAAGLRWMGEIPWQKWNTFFTKVLSRFSQTGGIRLRVTVDVDPPGGISEQALGETRIALEELGCQGDLAVKPPDES